MVKVLLGVKRFVALIAVCVAWAVAAAPMAGCDRTKAALAKPASYVPHQQFGGNGAPCMDGSCPVINQPKQWLKPCK